MSQLAMHGTLQGSHIKLGKTNTMTNTWGKTKTKTDKDKKVEGKRISVKFSNRLSRLYSNLIVKACYFGDVHIEPTPFKKGFPLLLLV